jgi:hypothetical protein
MEEDRVFANEWPPKLYNSVRVEEWEGSMDKSGQI